MDKEVVHIYNGVLLSHKKEQIWVSGSEVDEPRAYYTEWSKSEREKQMLSIHTYVLFGLQVDQILDCEKIKPVNPKGNKYWIFIGRTDAEAETPILWPPDMKNWLIGKDPDAGKDWRWKEKGMTEGKMVIWHLWHNGYEFE